MKMTAINPATGEEIKTYQTMTSQEISQTVQTTQNAFLNWKKTSFPERSAYMKQAAHILRDNAEEYAILMAEEMGKTINEGRAEANKCAWVCDYYAENAEKFLKPETVETDASKSYVSFQPLGVVLAVMPWNFPFWQVFRFVVPALMAGNVCLLKHSSNVPQCALKIEEIFSQAGLPPSFL